MDELRKHAILFAATIFAARKLTELGDRHQTWLIADTRPS